MVLRQGGVLIAAGVGLGMLLALGGARLMRDLLFGVAPFDALTYVSVALLLASIALIACAIPARRAMRVDPMVDVYKRQSLIGARKIARLTTWHCSRSRSQAISAAQVCPSKCAWSRHSRISFRFWVSRRKLAAHSSREKTRKAATTSPS